MAASYSSRKSLGSESPSNCGRMVGLKRGGHGIFSNSTERGWWGSVVGNAVVGEAGLESHTRLPLHLRTSLR